MQYEDNKTYTFIIGAGSSMSLVDDNGDYADQTSGGYPSLKKLKNRIINLSQQLENTSPKVFNGMFISSFHRDFSQAIDEIDLYISSNINYKEIASYLVSRVLLESEAYSSNLKLPWIDKAVSHFVLNPSTTFNFIIFNYDREVEYRFIRKVVHTMFQGCYKKALIEINKRVQFIHPYGRLPELAFEITIENNSTAIIKESYNGDDDDIINQNFRHWPPTNQLSQSSCLEYLNGKPLFSHLFPNDRQVGIYSSFLNNIEFMHSDGRVLDEVKTEVSKALTTSDTIYFLGFGFADYNMQVLFEDNRLIGADTKFFATSIGLSPYTTHCILKHFLERESFNVFACIKCDELLNGTLSSHSAIRPQKELSLTPDYGTISS